MAILKQGSKGSAVKKLQEQLNKTKIAGAKLKVDGVFGPKTLEAVKTFQKKEKVSKLKVDGVVGPKTQAALDRYLDPNKVDPAVVKKKIAAMEKSMSAYAKYLDDMHKYLMLIEKQKKAKKPIDKEVAQLGKKWRQLESLADGAASTVTDPNSAMMGGLMTQHYQDLAKSTKWDWNELKSIRDENQRDFDRRIADALKRMAATRKVLAKMQAELTKMRKQVAK